MLEVLKSSWALLLGMMLLMVGNGVQGTLLGIRGGLEDFGTFEMSVVMSAYFVGFLGGSKLAPEMIRRVGHVRVFAALGSLISAVLILYPAFPSILLWTFGRVIIGFCFSAVYVTAESWLNNSTDNEHRGQALSLYMIVQMFGIVSAQGLLVLGDPSGFILFIVPSVLVSISFAPILLSISPTPAFEATKPMTLRELYGISPLGCIGMVLLGGVFAAQFGMAAVYGTERGLSVGQISAFVSSIYIGALLLQYPIGWISDRMDRRLLIFAVSAIGGGAGVLAYLFDQNFTILLVSAFIIGGMSNPLYALLLAYTNDFLEHEDMAAASGGLVFINGVGAIAGPLVVGWMMGVIGPEAFFLFVALLMIGLAFYAAYRMTQRASTTEVEDMVSYAPILATTSPVAVEVAQEYYIETELEDASDGISGD
ncbi:MFS transporter [Nereida sp. MMG025]|uniref:MFS transporter n=1 Tax=Nereida sp. MMG025 TaxID=2909981 RepID=UPI001F210F29|nr:MFS transporter [Nereida sp. MMG025]MCF6443640.1 MFS transporter [Nereida sp. MMG025]